MLTIEELYIYFYDLRAWDEMLDCFCIMLDVFIDLAVLNADDDLLEEVGASMGFWFIGYAELGLI